jgi:hypothetical protein
LTNGTFTRSSGRQTIALTGRTVTGSVEVHAVDLESWIMTGAAALLLAVLVAVPVGMTIVLLRVAFRRMSGRRGRFDGLFVGTARANAMHWHLNGGGPHPDDISVVPPAPGPPGRRKGGDRRTR